MSHTHIRDHYLPPDRQAYRRAEPRHGRVIVIAPTRAACETIELATRTEVETVLEREHGDEIRGLAAGGDGFGIVAATGTGKTFAIRPIAEQIVGTPLRVGVVNREREATPETPTWSVVIVTTGIARRWYQSDLIFPQDTIIVDEIHQTSAELELCLALGKRVGCRIIWLSATVDPSFYQTYLNSATVLETTAFDPRLAATVATVMKKPFGFFDHDFLRRVMTEKRGVAVFLPTRAEVEELADVIGRRQERLNAAFYHGGEPISAIRPFLEGKAQKPFLLAMTAAGQSAINVRGLDTVVIYDAQYKNVIERGRNVLTRLYLGANEILQMAGRVHGRVRNGRVWILTDRDIDFAGLTPTPPEFQLAGDSERIALTAAALGIDLTELDLPVPLDRVAYQRARGVLIERGIIEGNRLTEYGADVEAMPVDRPWGELLVRVQDELTPHVAVTANVDSLHRLTREESDLRGLVVDGSDHLTAYNVYAEAVNLHGHLGRVYGLPRHLFDDRLREWADARGIMIKAIEDIALGMASVYRTLEVPLPEQLPSADSRTLRKFRELLAAVMPLDLVIDEQTADGESVRIARGSTARSWGAIVGSLRYFADKRGIPRAAIDGTNIPLPVLREHARDSGPTVEYRVRRKEGALYRVRRREYHGFELDRSETRMTGPFPDDVAEAAQRALGRAVAGGLTEHPDQRRVERMLNRLGELWRRSGGTLEGASPETAAGILAEQLARVGSWDDFQSTRLRIDVDDLVSAEEQDVLDALPSSAHVRGDRVPLDYEIENGVGVVRLRLREGQARRFRDSDLPDVDRPLRFTVVRGRHGRSVRAESVDELRKVVASLPRRSPRAPRGRRGSHPRYRR